MHMRSSCWCPEAPLLHRDCSSTFPPHTWKVSSCGANKGLQAPATVTAPFWSGRGSSHSWKDNKMRMNLQSGIKDTRI